MGSVLNLLPVELPSRFGRSLTGGRRRKSRECGRAAIVRWQKINVCEFLWKFTKKQCLNNCYYEMSEAFKVDIDDCLQNIDKKFESQIASLMTLRFQTFKNDQVMEGL